MNPLWSVGIVLFLYSVYIFIEWRKWRHKDRILQQQIEELEKDLKSDDTST